MPEINITQARILVEAALVNEEKVKTLTPTERKALKVMIQEVKNGSHQDFWIQGTSYTDLKNKLLSLETAKQSSRTKKVMNSIGNIFISSKKLLDSAKEIQPQQLSTTAVLREISENQRQIQSLLATPASSPIKPSPDLARNLIAPMRPLAVKSPQQIKLEKTRQELLDQLKLCALKEAQTEVSDLAKLPPQDQIKKLDELKDKYTKRSIDPQKTINSAKLSVVQARLNKLNTPKGYVDEFVSGITNPERSAKNIKAELTAVEQQITLLQKSMNERHQEKIQLLRQHVYKLGSELQNASAS